MPNDLGNFLDNLQSSLVQTAQAQAIAPTKKDEQFDLFCTPSPNAIEWAIGADYLDVPTVYHHKRQYQVVRDFFQLRCPLPSCNNQSFEYKDCWDKGQDYLESENLLVWSNKYKEDICPSCNTTRFEFIEDGLLSLYNQMHLVCGMRCLPGDEMVLTNTGFVRLDTLINTSSPNTFKPINLNVIGQDGVEAATDAYYAGSHQYYTVSLQKGLDIRGSAIHPVWSESAGAIGWHRLSSLHPGDKVFVSSNNWPALVGSIDQSEVQRCLNLRNYESAYTIPNEWSIELAELLGYLTSEGQCGRKYSVRFTNGDKETLNHFSQICFNLFGIRPRDYSENHLTVDLNGIGIREFLKYLGLTAVNAHHKELPRSLWSASREIICAFLRAYFEGDGTASVDNTGKPVVAAYTVSEKLAKDLQRVLWALDIRASITKTKSRKFSSREKFNHYAYSIRIYGGEIINYAKSIGFISTRKRQNLQNCIVKLDAKKLQPRKDYLLVKNVTKSNESIDLFDIHVPGTHSFSTGIVLNHNSGKTATAGIIGTYIEHRILNIGHSTPAGLAKYFNQLPKQPFEITFVASTDVQSADTIWARYTSLRQQSPWLQKYIRWIKQKEVEQQTPNGAKPWSYEERDKYIINGALNLKLNSLNSNCFIGSTQVLMGDYKYRSIKDIKIGDTVIDKSGMPQTVENHWVERPPNELVQIDTYFGKSLICTPNHRFPVWAWPRSCACGCGNSIKPGRVFSPGHANKLDNKTRKSIHVDGSGGHIRRIPFNYQPHVDLEAKDIRRDDFLMIPRKFDEIRPTQPIEAARLLGYYISEGCHNRHRLKSGDHSLCGTEFSFNINEDQTHANDVRHICDKLGINHNTQYIHDRNVLVISTTNQAARDLASWFDTNGGHLAKSKVLSKEVMCWPLSYKIELLKGMFRGDGTHYIGSRSPSVSYTTASIDLAKQLQLILAHVGIYSGLVTHNRKPGGFNKKPATKYMINIGGGQAIEFANIIWGLNNKFSAYNGKTERVKCWVTSDFIYVPVKSINILNNTEPVYNMTVSNDHSYIVDGLGTYNSGGMAGRTRIAAFIDELARFDNTESKRSGDEAYRVLENSLRTIRSASINTKSIPWLGTMVSISSPISEDDKSMRLLKQAPTIKGMYSGHYATWEFNPDQPREMFDDDFEKDPIGAMRDFGARPPTSASPLIQDQNRFRELAIQTDLKPTAIFKKILHSDRTGREYVSTTIESAQLLRNGERYICFDMGASFDQFAGACAHGEWIHTPEGRQLVTVYDWVIRLLPENKPRRDIWFDLVVNAIDYLSKYYFISRVEFDRWQSTYLIQQIRNRGILCEMKGTTADQFIKFVNDVTYSKVRMLPPMPDDHKVEPPMMSPQGLAFYELEHLERSPDLKKVFNPKKGQKRGWDSDDVATVVVHVNNMVQSSVVDINNSNSAQSRLRRESAGGHTWEDGGKLFRPFGSKRGW